MRFNYQKPTWSWLGLALALCFSMTASAMPNPISKVRSTSKTVVQKAFDGGKSVARTSVRVVKDAGSTAWNASDSLVDHVRSL